jgi:ubiquinone/menaquinone biosynthesis C-methylase UbiE
MIQTIRGWARSRFDKVRPILFPKSYSLRVCSTDGLWNNYFTSAEKFMDSTWRVTIWPIIAAADFASVLELAPGAGRNTEKLVALARELHAIDMNEYALRRLRQRFAGYSGSCQLHIHKNDGTNLRMIADQSISFVYCWDSAVHFDRTVMRDYVNEFARVMRPGATMFIHHSDLGDTAVVDILTNPHWRSNVSKELFAKYCLANGLEVVKQIPLPWPPPVDGVVISDCISVIRKPGVTAS